MMLSRLAVFYEYRPTKCSLVAPCAYLNFHSEPPSTTSQLLVFQLALKLLGLRNLADSAVEIVLADRLSLILDG